MINTQKLFARIGLFLFFLGIAVGVWLDASMVWGDLEASMFISGIRAEEKIKSLKCPIFITPSEHGTISAILENPTDEAVERYVRANITQGYVTYTRQEESYITVEPGKDEKIEWEISPDDAAYHRLILFRVYVFQKRSLPSLEGHCGVVLVNVSDLNGTQVALIMFLSSIALLIGGRAIWESKNRTKEGFIKNFTKAIDALTIVLILSLLASYFGLWAMGILSIALIIILLGALLGAYVMST
jgi:hypothetical protein